MKEKRQAEIARIIADQAVETQEQLLKLLRLRGIQVTQATISRDIKELHLVKEPVGGVYRYVQAPAGTAERRGRTGRLRSIFRQGVSSVDAAQNIIVVKTMAGLAGAAGATLDSMDISGFVGSLAGDDTVLIIMRTEQDAEAFLKEIRSMLKS